MKVSYETGPRSVTIAATGQKAKRGVPIDVGDSIGRQLVAQGWKQHEARKPRAESADKPKPQAPKSPAKDKE